MSKESIPDYPEVEKGPNKDVPEIDQPTPEQADERPKPPTMNSEDYAPSSVVEIEVMPGVYEVYDKVSGELVDIGYSED